MWIVTINRPYYPSVEYFTDEIQAQNYYEKLVKEENESDGEYGVKVSLSEVKLTTEICTEY